MRPVPLVVLVVALLLTVFGGAGAPSLPAVTLAGATQGAANAAGVVIKDPHGGPTKTVCVRFAEESISARELLDRANRQLPSIDPVYSTEFGAQGTAVCALCGEGCPAGDCFCQDRYWNYNVAVDGRWVRSSRGVDQRTIRHGDVDGWAFGGDGAAPPYIAFEVVCAAEPEPSPTPTAPSPTPAPTTPAPEPPQPATTPTATPAAPPAATPDPTTQPAATPTATASEPGEQPAASAAPSPQDTTDASAAPGSSASDATVSAPGEDASGGGWLGTVLFVLLLASLVGATLLRGRRSR